MGKLAGSVVAIAGRMRDKRTRDWRVILIDVTSRKRTGNVYNVEDSKLLVVVKGINIIGR